MEAMMRVCKKCGEEKPIEEFLSQKGKDDPYKHRCKRCKHAGRLAPPESTIGGMRVCSKCGIKKPEECFKIVKSTYKDKHYTRRLRRCDECVYAKQQEWRSQKKELCAQYSQSYRNKYPAKAAAIQKKYSKTHIEKRTEWNKKQKRKDINIISNGYVKERIKKTFGLTVDQVPRDLIENYRQQIKVKRLLKQKKNENTETS